ncbi:MAG: addiction module toxin, HicA family [Dehalococcoidia bacterium]|nr:addiction module toxin, HicA family [Dehalococcoidia bacterium]
MPLRPLTARQVVRKLQRAGFQKVRQRGGHARYANSQGRGVTVPIHPGDIPVHVLRFILQQAGLSEADWEQF